MGTGDEDGDDWEGYESGPFCPHWAPMGDCDTPCSTCKHRCHSMTCDEDGCDCAEATAEP